MKAEKMEWKAVSDELLGDWFELDYRGVKMFLEKRPPYCDRGNWYAKIFEYGLLWIDAADGFPRYYFDFEVAKKECEAFLLKREQLGQFNREKVPEA
jgi:hypothetical protein